MVWFRSHKVPNINGLGVPESTFPGGLGWGGVGLGGAGWGGVGGLGGGKIWK